MSKPIDSKIFLTFFDQDFRLVKEHEFRKALFFDGVEKNYRDVVWRFLFHFYSFDSTKRERFVKRNEKFVEYALMKNRWSKIYEKFINSKVKEEDDDKLTPPPIDFNIYIDENQDFYEKNNNQEDFSFIEETQDLNLDYIKIQTLLNISRKNISNSKLINDIRQIDKDIERTSYLNEINGKKSNEEIEAIKNSLKNILITFSAFNQSSSDEMSFSRNFDLGYTQGMNEIATVFISVFKQESVAYWCFSNYMIQDTYSNSGLTLNTVQIDESHVLKASVAHYFSDFGISKKINDLKYLLKIIDPEFSQKLVDLKLEHMNFSHEWLLLNFKRCFNSTIEYQKCFEVLSSRFIEFHNSALKNISVKKLYSFDLFICLSLIKEIRHKIAQNCDSEIEFYEVFSEFNKSRYLEKNFDSVIKEAQSIFDEYCIISHSATTNENIEAKKSNPFFKFKDLIFN